MSSYIFNFNIISAMLSWLKNKLTTCPEKADRGEISTSYAFDGTHQAYKMGPNLKVINPDPMQNKSPNLQS